MSSMPASAGPGELTADQAGWIRNGSYASITHASDSYLYASEHPEDPDGQRNFFLGFSLPDSAHRVENATLRFQSSACSSEGNENFTMGLYWSNDDSWTRSSLSWEQRPEAPNLAGEFVIVTAACPNLYSLDVTTAVNEALRNSFFITFMVNVTSNATETSLAIHDATHAESSTHPVLLLAGLDAYLLDLRLTSSYGSHALNVSFDTSTLAYSVSLPWYVGDEQRDSALSLAATVRDNAIATATPVAAAVTSVFLDGSGDGSDSLSGWVVLATPPQGETTTYTITVHGNSSGVSRTYTIDVERAPSPCCGFEAPTGVLVEEINAGTVLVSWDEPTTQLAGSDSAITAAPLLGYRVYHSRGGWSPFVMIVDLVPAGTVAHTFSSAELKPGDTYRFKVAAITATGCTHEACDQAGPESDSTDALTMGLALLTDRIAVVDGECEGGCTTHGSLLATITDGIYLNSGLQPTSAVYWTGLSPWLYWDLGGAYWMRSGRMQVDINDVYVLEVYSATTNVWELVWRSEATAVAVNQETTDLEQSIVDDSTHSVRLGMQARPDIDNATRVQRWEPIQGTAVRLRAVEGDNLYGVSEVVVYGAVERLFPWDTTLLYCTVSGAGHFSTFADQSFDFYAAGEYTLLESPSKDISVHICLTPTAPSSDVRTGVGSIWLAIPAGNITIFPNASALLEPQGGDTSTMVENTIVSFNTSTIVRADGLHVEVELASGLLLRATTASSYINVRLRAPSEEVANMIGLCGDGTDSSTWRNVSGIVLPAEQVASNTTLYEYYGSTFLVPQNASIPLDDRLDWLETLQGATVTSLVSAGSAIAVAGTYSGTTEASGLIFNASSYSTTNAVAGDFETGVLASVGDKDFFVAVINSTTNNVEWLYGNGGTGEDEATAVAIESDVVLVAGYYKSASVSYSTELSTYTWSQYATPDSTHQQDAFIVAFDINDPQDSKWQLLPTTTGSTGSHQDAITAMVPMHDGMVLVAGYLYSTALRIGGSTVSNTGAGGTADIFLAMVSVSDGTVSWARVLGEAGDEMPRALRAMPFSTSSGIAFLGGYYETEDAVFGNVTLQLQGARNGFIAAVGTTDGCSATESVDLSLADLQEESSCEFADVATEGIRLGSCTEATWNLDLSGAGEMLRVVVESDDYQYRGYIDNTRFYIDGQLELVTYNTDCESGCTYNILVTPGARTLQIVSWSITDIAEYHMRVRSIDRACVSAGDVAWASAFTAYAASAEASIDKLELWPNAPMLLSAGYFAATPNVTMAGALLHAMAIENRTDLEGGFPSVETAEVVGGYDAAVASLSLGTGQAIWAESIGSPRGWQHAAALSRSSTRVPAPSDNTFGVAVSCTDEFTLVGDSSARLAFIYSATGVVTTIEGYQTEQDFGAAVALSENYAVVGAPASEKAFIFHRKGDDLWNRTAVAILEPTTSASDTFFGSAVAITDGYALVGAYGINTSFVFDFSDGKWSTVPDRSLTSGSTDSFGWMVAATATHAVVATGEDSVYVYDLSVSSEFGSVVTISYNSPDVDMLFGRSIALSDSFLAISSADHQVQVTRLSTGVVTILDGYTSAADSMNASQWNSLADLNYDRVAITDTELLVGVPQDSKALLFTFSDDDGVWSSTPQVTIQSAESGFGTAVANYATGAFVGAAEQNKVFAYRNPSVASFDMVDIVAGGSAMILAGTFESASVNVAMNGTAAAVAGLSTVVGDNPLGTQFALTEYPYVVNLDISHVGDTDILLASVQPSDGQVLWTKGFGSAGADAPQAVASSAEDEQFVQVAGMATDAMLGPVMLSSGTSWVGSFSSTLDWRPHDPPVHSHHLDCPEDLDRLSAYTVPTFAESSVEDSAQAICDANSATLAAPFNTMCLEDAASAGDADWTLPAIAASVDHQYEETVYRTREQATISTGIVDAIQTTGPCAGVVESSLSFEPPHPGVPVAISLMITLCVHLYVGEVVSVALPGFTGQPTRTHSCPIDELDCTTPLEASLPLSGNDAPKFIAHWVAKNDIQDGTLELKLASRKLSAYTPVTLTVEAYLISPPAGVPPASMGFTFAIDFNSPWRVVSSDVNLHGGILDNVVATPVFGLASIARFSNVALSFDPPTAATATEISFSFTLSVDLNPGEAVHLTLPGFTGEEFTGISLGDGSTAGFHASWTLDAPAGYPAAPPRAELLPSNSLILERNASGGILAAGSPVLVVLPATAGITLPSNGMCDLWSTYSILLASTSKPPVEAVSAATIGALIATTELCPRPSPEFDVPRSVTMGAEIIVHWRAGSSLQPRVSDGHDFVALYNAGECSQAPELTTIANSQQLPGDDDVNDAITLARWQNTCHLAVSYLPPDQESGEIRFPHSTYKNAGTYEVRYFAGDSPAGGGMVCRGLRSLADTRIHGTYVHCVLESVAQSEVIHVQVSTENAARMGGGWDTLPGLHEWAEEPYMRSYEGGDIRSPL